MRVLGVFIVFFLGGCGDHTTLTSKAQEKGALYTQWLYEGKYNLLWDNSDDRFKAMNGSLEDFSLSSTSLLQQLGNETQVLNERVLFLDTDRLYDRSALFPNVDIPVVIEWLFDSSYRILYSDYYLLEPEAPSRFLDYQTKTNLRLPFNGAWVVLWGGRSTLDNYHAPAPDQRFASDFMIFKEGFWYSGDGSRNEDYYCFGQPIVAPADGMVVSSDNTVADNPPGAEDNLEKPLGNHVILDHQNGEFSFLCHFQQGSVQVQAGDSVVTGQLLGLCGNSGASDIPHLHYHLQTTAVPFEGEGLPAQFRSYRANGKQITRGEPTRGQKVQNLNQ
jgi:murein DD-endopeptidase MepM/ murein hydrolase activator NlpD